MTIKDLQKAVQSLASLGDNQLLQRLGDKPFWIWNRERHKQEYMKTEGIRDTASDPKIKLQATALANDCYKFILDITTNAGVISDALKFIEKKKEQLNTMQKIEEMEEEKAANNIF